MNKKRLRIVATIITAIVTFSWILKTVSIDTTPVYNLITGSVFITGFVSAFVYFILMPTLFLILLGLQKLFKN